MVYGVFQLRWAVVSTPFVTSQKLRQHSEQRKGRSGLLPLLAVWFENSRAARKNRSFHIYKKEDMQQADEVTSGTAGCTL